MLEIKSTVNSVLGSWARPWIRTREENLRTVAQLEWRDVRTDAAGAALTRDRLEVARLGATYDRSDRWEGISTARAMLHQGLSGHGADGNTQPPPSRANGRGNFTKLTLDLSRLQQLGARTHLMTSFTSQFSRHALLASEELSLGGAHYGRAYDDGEIAGDNGYALMLEWRHHPEGLPRHAQLYAFADAGKGVGRRRRGPAGAAQARLVGRRPARPPRRRGARHARAGQAGEYRSPHAREQKCTGFRLAQRLVLKAHARPVDSRRQTPRPPGGWRRATLAGQSPPPSPGPAAPPPRGRSATRFPFLDSPSSKARAMPTAQPSRQVLRRAALRARRAQRTWQRLMQRHQRRAALSPLALVVGWLMAGAPAHANPSGGQVVAGSATIQSTAPGTLTITQGSERAIIHWQSFGIGAGESVHFAQPSARSVTLNRVVGNDPSAIYGQLHANGIVMLVNPNGIVFGRGARVDVGGLVATTTNLRNEDFMAGWYAFNQPSARLGATVENHGLITIRDSGLAALVAPGVRNSGVIEARLGRVALGAANRFTLDFHGDGLLSFGADAAVTEAQSRELGALVRNSGELRAEGGTVLLTAQAVKGVIDQVINTSGIVAATAVSGSGGRIVLSGGTQGTVAVGGTLDASSAAGPGGTVVATGQHIVVAGTARIDASGGSGGGEIALGSTGLTVPARPFGDKAGTLEVARGAQLHADAGLRGDGGTITLWSSERTLFAGSLSARGGAQGGNGGFAEVSSAKDIGLAGQADLRAPQGTSGRLLIDPTDLRITDAPAGGSQDGNAADGAVGAGHADQGTGSTLNTLSRGLLEGLAGNANIVLQATGQITVEAMAGNLINLATTAGHGFTLQSTQEGGIRFADANTEIRTQGGAITLEALGLGSTLTQIGRLSSNGGAITLRAAGDLSLAGTVNAGAGAIQAHSTMGSITGVAGTQPQLAGSAVTLSAYGSTGSNGAIGSSAQPLRTATAQLSATAGSGGVHIANTGALNLTRLAAEGHSSLTASGTLTAGQVDAGSATLALASSGGSVLDDGDAATVIRAGTLNVSAAGAIGSSTTRLVTTAGTLSAQAASGGIYAGALAATSVLQSITSGDGAIDIQTGGSATLTSLVSSTSAAANTITVAATGAGALTVGTVNAGSLGHVSLATTAGAISGTSGGNGGNGGSLITGSTVTLNAVGGAVTANTAAARLDVQASTGNISITQAGHVTLERITTPGTSASITSTSGDITVGSIATSASGQVSLAATAGGIYDDGNAGTHISTGTATLNAGGAIGTSSHAVQTRATGLSVSSAGHLYLANSDTPLTSLSITHRHATPGVANALQVSSPYLTFELTDDGTQYTLHRLVGVPLAALSFSGDQTSRIGQVQAAGSVSITATAGSLLDDGNLQSRITAGSTLTLSAAQGHVGNAVAPVAVNASALALTTRGDLYVDSIADLSTLTIQSSHPDAATSFGMAVRAPALRMAVTDAPAGHSVATLIDTTGLTLNFTSDRAIALGRVDLGATGTARFTSSAGAILDDGDKATRVLANTASFTGTAVGAAGAGHLDVVAGTLAATASAGGVYVQLPMATGSTNTTGTVTLGTLNAAGPVAITALEGDLSLGGFLTATHQAVSLSAPTGSILSPAGYSIGIGNGALTLSAGQAIGTAARAIPITGSGGTLSAAAGSGLYTSANGATTLHNLSASTTVSHAQSSGNVTVGTVNAGAGTVALTSSAGAIVDDANAGTAISGSQVALVAQGSAGAAGTPLNINAPAVSVTANGDIAFNSGLALTSLSLTRGAGAAGSYAINGVGGQTFSLADTGSAHELNGISSTSPLAFSFAGARDVRIGTIDVGAGGSASISSAASLLHGAAPGARITAGTVSLTAGAGGSIGDAGQAIALSGTTALSLSTGRHAFVASDATLVDLSLTSTNTTTAPGTASLFGLSAPGQTFAITDSGTTQTLNFSGTALGNASFSTNKNIEVGAIAATGDVTLSTAGGGANSNISSTAGGAGTIAANRVLLAASATTAGGGSIGSSTTALRVDTPTVILNGSGNVYIDDAQSLTRLDMTVSHGTNTTFGYGITAGNINNFSITDGNTQSLGLAVSGVMDFSYSVDRALSLSTIDVGTSTTGTVALTSRSAPTGTNAQINRSSGSITGGSVTLWAAGTNGGVGAGATLSTNTRNLSIATGGNVSVSNSTTLNSLSLDARHNTSGSSTHSYAISSTGLTFSVSDTLGNNAFQLANIAQSGLDLSIKADRVLTASSVNTGAGGRVTLTSSSYVQGGSGANAGSPSITTGDLTLNGGSVFGYQGSTPLYTAAGTLSSNLSNVLYLSNAGALTLNTNTVGSSADVASSNNSLLQGSGTFTTPTLRLSANQSLGPTGALLTNARRLTLVSRGHIDVSNASDLYALSINSTHGTPGAQNNIAVAAPRLALALTDSALANEYHLSHLADASGLDFTLSTDVALSLGTVQAQAGRALSLASTGTATSITNDGASLLSAGSITLSATGSVGAAGGSGTRLQTDAPSVSVITGANAFVDSAQDLASLSLTSTQAAGGTAPVYQFTAPALTFDITDDGTTRVRELLDGTGLNLSLNTQRNLAVETLSVGRTGTVSLTSAGDILGDGNSSRRITAASASFVASNGGAIGSVGNPIRLSAPLVSLSASGALNVESDTHIDRLSIQTSHPTPTYGGTYSIVSVPISGAAYSLFTATDSLSGTELTSLNDPLGLAFSFTTDRAMQVGSLNLGSTGTVALTGTGAGGIQGDGDANTRVRAASLSMVSYGGAVGGAGSGNAIDATVNGLSAVAQGGVTLALHGRTALGSVAVAGGAIGITNDVGDIALGAINAGGNAVSIDNQGGSLLSGSIFNATTVSLTAAGSIGSASAIGTAAAGGLATTLTAAASAANGASGSIAVSESYNLAASSVTAPASVTLASGFGLAFGTVASGSSVSLSSVQGSISGIDGSNSVSGSSVSLSARFGTGNGLGTSGTRLNVNAPQLVLNTPGSVYVTNSADLNRLVLDRANFGGTGSGGTLSVISSGLTFSATDTANTTTLTHIADASGLDFSYLGAGALAVGSIDVGSTGSVLLQSQLSGGNGSIGATGGGSLITAGMLSVQAIGADSGIGSSGSPLRTAVGTLTAAAGTGGVFVSQTGNLHLRSVATTGALAVNASSGDLLLGTLSYGSGSVLNLSAGAGSLLATGSTLAGGGAGAAMTLSAANGIGTEAAPLQLNASAGHTVNASVTGTGSLHLRSTGTLEGGLTTAVNNGATRVVAAGNTRLASLTSGTDAAGNDIQVRASAGDLTVVNVSGGANASHNAIELVASAGRIVATGGTSVQAQAVSLFGAQGVGSSGLRLGVPSGQRIQVGSAGGAIYLGASAPAVLAGVASGGGLIDISSSANLQLAHAQSGGGHIQLNGTAANVALTAGSIHAGAGTVTIASTAAGGTVQDDGNSHTRVSGATVALNGTAGVGSAGNAVGTSAQSLLLASGAGGAGIFVDDGYSGGVALTSVTAAAGAIDIRSAGPMVATAVAGTGAVTLTTRAGDLTVANVSSSASTGSVTLVAAGSVLAAGGVGPQVAAHSVGLAAGADIGVVTDPLTGAGTPLRVNASNLTGLSSAGSQGVISLRSEGSLVLPANLLTLGPGGSAYLSSAGDIGFGPGHFAVNGNLLLNAPGTLVLPAAGLAASGRLALLGATDIRSAGATPRSVTVAGDSVFVRSGAAGGDTTFHTTASHLDIALQGAGALTVNNTGTLASATLATQDGHINASSSQGLRATQVSAGGAGRHVQLVAEQGDLSVASVAAGSTGTIHLEALQGGVSVDGPLDGAQALAANAGTGGVAFGAALGGSAPLGSLVVATSGTVRFSAGARAGSIQLSAPRLLFNGALSAPTGGITLALTAADGRIEFAPGSTVAAASGFMQTGGAAIDLPDAISVSGGPILIDATAYRGSGLVSLSSSGDIRLAGLQAPGAVARLSTGGGIVVGQALGGAAQRLVVSRLEVPTAASATVYGRIGGLGGALAAARVASPLSGAPYFMNDTPWGPLAALDTLATVTATTVPPQWARWAASTPRLLPLFNGEVHGEGIVPAAVPFYATPALLTVMPMAPLAAQ